MKLKIASLTALVAFLVLAIYSHQDVISKHQLSKLKPGMSKFQVESIIGQPDVRFENKHLWRYEKTLVFGWVDIAFDHSDKFVEYNLERY